MHILQKIKRSTVVTSILFKLVLVCGFFAVSMSPAQAGPRIDDRDVVINHQIDLLRSRYENSYKELKKLQSSDNFPAIDDIDLVGASYIDKAQLGISIAESNLESVEIELSDARQKVSWLEKSIQETKNQINVLNIFGNRIVKKDLANIASLRSGLVDQQKDLALQKKRVKYLRKLYVNKSSVLQLKQDKFSKLKAQLKSHKLMRLKQQEVKDELAYQQLQNKWLTKLDVLNNKLDQTHPVKAKSQYQMIEQEIFLANENASKAYVSSLIARYKDQVQRLSDITIKSSSISQLHEINDQVSTLTNQIDRLDSLIKNRQKVINKHLSSMDTSDSLKSAANIKPALTKISEHYQASLSKLTLIDAQLSKFKDTVDDAMQAELSARQGMPTFAIKSLVDIGKELLLIPALTFQVLKSLAVKWVANFKSAGTWMWFIFVAGQILLFNLYVGIRRVISALLAKPSDWHEKINTKWLGVKWLDNVLLDLYLLTNVVGTLFIFNVPINNYYFFLYVACSWLFFKSMLTISRVSLVETTSHPTGDDMRLYKRLRWSIWVGGSLTTAALFVYQLPLIYELKTIADRLFLLFMMVVSLMLLRYWDVFPTMVLSHMEKRHPYLEKSIRLLGILIPSLLLANSIIGLIGYVNLVMTVSWYEGLFLIVLIGYLVLRGLLTDAVEQLSRLVIRYSANGWLLTEAFLKPLDRVLRVTLMLLAGAALFLLYGWNKQSPIVERLNALLHYELTRVLNSSITPLSIIELMVVISVFYWTAKWTREFVFRMLAQKTRDMGVRNTMAILSQYAVVVVGAFIALRVLGIDLRALAVVAGMFAFGVGLGLRDMANNFFCGFLILLERPVRVGDIIKVNESEGEVTNIGGRAITIRTWDRTELFVPNSEIFNRMFINLTAQDNVVRCVLKVKVDRADSPHDIKRIINDLMIANDAILPEPEPAVLLREISDVLLEYELRYYVNIKQIRSRAIISSELLTSIWDAFKLHGIKTPYQQQEIHLRMERASSSKIRSTIDAHTENLLEKPELV